MVEAGSGLAVAAPESGMEAELAWALAPESELAWVLATVALETVAKASGLVAEASAPEPAYPLPPESRAPSPRRA